MLALFIKILKKDIKRKKAMNIILFVFMITASMLIASSINLLFTTTTALENFMNVSQISDNIIISFSDTESDKMMEEWADNCKKVKTMVSEDMLLVGTNDITLPENYKKLQDGATLTIARVPEKSNLVFDEQNLRFKLNSGEVAIPNAIKTATGLKIGEKIKITIGKVEKELVVKHYLKDVVFGSGLMGLKRFIVSDKDFEAFNGDTQKIVIKLWSVAKNDNTTNEEVEKDFSKTSIPSISTFSRDTVSYTYIMDLTTAAIMSIMSIFLIFISFLILRFTIRFTIEEDYKEIGIMKAIGLKNVAIKKIYLVKYFSLSLIGGVLGYLAGIPFTNVLKSSISQNIMMTSGVSNYLFAGAGSILIILITLLFCYICTGKINKMTAIDAIRQGETGERFSVSRKLKLHNMKSIGTPLFMALSDILTGFRKFLILMLTFIIGTIIIIVPINAINTITSDEILTLFGMANSDFNIRPEGYGVNYRDASVDKLLQDTAALENKIKNKGFETDLHPEIMFMAKVYAGNPDESKNILSMQAYDYSTENYTYLEGTAPKLENELALTKRTADYFGVGIGDSINCIERGGTKEYIITALFQSMNNLGFSVRFSEKHIMNMEDSSAVTLFGEFINAGSNKAELLEELKEKVPELKIRSSSEYVDSFMGNTLSQVAVIKNVILVIVLSINFLITCLVVRMLMTKELSEIALLKSIGIKNKDIKKWQALRIMIILVLSIIVGTLIANLSGSYLSSGIFSFMGGTQLKLTIKPLEVYLIYPLIIFTATMTAVLVSLGQIKRTNIWEINNRE